jgi:hypothetical protein
MSTLEQERKNEPLLPGYTIDEEGTFNVYAIEPKMYLEESITPQQQRRYTSLVVGVILLIMVGLSIAFTFAMS